MQAIADKYQAIADKYAGKLCLLYTLNGTQEAIICGRMNEFATIHAIDGPLSIEVNWPTVERKMESDKLFYTC